MQLWYRKDQTKVSVFHQYTGIPYNNVTLTLYLKERFVKQ